MLSPDNPIQPGDQKFSDEVQKMLAKNDPGTVKVTVHQFGKEVPCQLKVVKNVLKLKVGKTEFSAPLVECGIVVWQVPRFCLRVGK